MEETGYIGANMSNVLHTVNSDLTEKDNEAFALLKTDEDRTAFMLERDLIHNTLIFHAHFEQKSPTKAKQLREEGNKLFQKREYRQSVKVYTASLLQAPTELTYEESVAKDGEDPDVDRRAQLPLAFANRSAALFHLQKYDLCIKDVDMAMQSGYPRELLYKLHDRRAKCYLKLKNRKPAIESAQSALDSMGDSKLDGKGLALWKVNLEKLLKQCEDLLDSQQKTEELFQLPKISEPNAKYPNMSSKADVKSKENVGRHLKAAVNVTVGDLIVAEKPFASVLLQAFYENHCYHCLRYVVWSIPDHQCGNVQFCSQLCRQKAWEEYHSTEYRFLNLLGNDWCGTIGQLVFRILRKVGFKNLMGFLQENKGKEPDYEQGVFNKEGVYDDGFFSVYNMVTNIKQRVPEGLSDFAVFAIYLTKLLQLSGFFAEDELKTQMDTRNNKTLVTVAGLVMKLMQVVQLNARGIVELKFPSDFEDPKPRDIGMGMYPTVALINHSCEPSAVAVFHGDNLVVKAIRNILKGKEISIDYGMVFYRNVLTQRRMNLSLRYSFQCSCPACTKNWPLWRDLDHNYPNWRCEECGAELNCIRTIGGSLVRCDSCNHSQDLEECMNRLSTSHDVYSRSMEEALAGNVEFALPGIQGHLSLCQKYLLPPWRDLVVAQAAVMQCFRMLGNVRLL